MFGFWDLNEFWLNKIWLLKILKRICVKCLWWRRIVLQRFIFVAKYAVDMDHKVLLQKEGGIFLRWEYGNILKKDWSFLFLNFKMGFRKRGFCFYFLEGDLGRLMVFPQVLKLFELDRVNNCFAVHLNQGNVCLNVVFVRTTTANIWKARGFS